MIINYGQLAKLNDVDKIIVLSGQTGLVSTIQTTVSKIALMHASKAMGLQLVTWRQSQLIKQKINMNLYRFGVFLKDATIKYKLKRAFKQWKTVKFTIFIDFFHGKFVY